MGENNVEKGNRAFVEADMQFEMGRERLPYSENRLELAVTS